jgi:hypothetical protein
MRTGMVKQVEYVKFFFDSTLSAVHQTIQSS